MTWVQASQLPRGSLPDAACTPGPGRGFEDYLIARVIGLHCRGRCCRRGVLSVQSFEAPDDPPGLGIVGNPPAPAPLAPCLHLERRRLARTAAHTTMPPPGPPCARLKRRQPAYLASPARWCSRRYQMTRRCPFLHWALARRAGAKLRQTTLR